MFIQYLFSDFQYFIYWIVIIIISISLHEFFHALAAYYEGDTTAKDQGYFTLDPVRHMGVPSLILLIMAGICWGLCPVNPSKFRHRFGDALVSFAGPFANLLLLIIFSTLYAIFNKYNISFMAHNVQDNLLYFFKLASIANAALIIFNLIPIPPLDGSKMFENAFPSLRNFYSQIGNAGFAVIFLLFWMPGFNKAFWEFAGASAISVRNIISAILIF